MTDDSTPDMFNEGVVKKPLSSVYLLTSVRQLVRILDIGLVVPELVTCIDDVIATFSIEQLPALNTIEGYPAVPVLLELKIGATKPQSAYPASTIKAIHFSTRDELEDYQARGFENVPNALFTFEVTPALFDKDPQANVAALLPKIDRSVLRQNYRQYDVLAGLLWDSITQAVGAEEVGSLLQSLVSYSVTDDVPAALNSWIRYEAEAGNLSIEDSGLMSTYLHLLGERDIDEGWVSADVLEELASRVLAPVADSESFQTWYRYTKAVINNEKELSTLTDDGDVLLRAILLHILNPEIDAIERMATRDPAPGIKVLKMAKTLAATRLGFAPLNAESKAECPGAFWLVSDLMAAFINKQPFSLANLIKTDVSEKRADLHWDHMLVNSYESLSLAGESGFDISREVREPESNVASLSDLKQLAEALDGIQSADNVDGVLTLQLTKSKCKNIPKQAAFHIVQRENGLPLFSSRLLDLTMPSHNAKLTGKRLSAAFIYQTEEGKDFRFELVPEKAFNAEITLAENVSDVELQTVFQRLMDAHAWMKTK